MIIVLSLKFWGCYETVDNDTTSTMSTNWNHLRSLKNTVASVLPLLPAELLIFSAQS